MVPVSGVVRLWSAGVHESGCQNLIPEDKPNIGAMQSRIRTLQRGIEAKKRENSIQNSEAGSGLSEKAPGSVPFAHRRILVEQRVGVRPQSLLQIQSRLPRWEASCQGREGRFGRRGTRDDDGRQVHLDRRGLERRRPRDDRQDDGQAHGGEHWNGRSSCGPGRGHSRLPGGTSGVPRWAGSSQTVLHGATFAAVRPHSRPPVRNARTSHTARGAPLLAAEAVIPVAHHRSRKTGREIPNIPRVTSLLFRVTAPTSCAGEFEYYVVRPGGVPADRALLQNGKIRVMLKPKRHS